MWHPWTSFPAASVLACVFLDLHVVRSQEQLSSCKYQCVPYFKCKSAIPHRSNRVYVRIDENKVSGCPHYLDKCCDQPQDIDRIPMISTCGKRQPEGVGFTLNGGKYEANYGEFPWMVAVLKRREGKGPFMQCGGSIIHPQVILTAAHCVKRWPTGLHIRAGEWDTQTNKERYLIQERNVSQVILHGGGVFLNDAALLVLESPLDISPVVGTICLPEKDESMDGRSCLVSGWGKDNFGKEGKYQVILKRLQVNMLSHDNCQDKLLETGLLKPGFKLQNGTVCAVGESVENDVCQGDGGGPLVCPSENNPKQYVQAGIVSWGIECNNGIPSLYAKVSVIRRWIDKQLASLNFN